MENQKVGATLLFGFITTIIYHLIICFVIYFITDITTNAMGLIHIPFMAISGFWTLWMLMIVIPFLVCRTLARADKELKE